MSTAGIRIGIDVGGTFTDLVATTPDGRVAHTKSPTVPEDPAAGVMNVIGLLAEQLGMTPSAVLRQTRLIVHGTTVATNALLERQGARVVLLATSGHRDVLEMREGVKHDRFNLLMPAPDPLVPRRMRLPVRERIRSDGQAEVPLTDEEITRVLGEIRKMDVDAIAVCLLHSYRQPDHETRLGDRLREAFPDRFVTVSSTVLPRIREYERTCTTAVNAYVGPVLSTYLNRLSSQLASAGYGGTLLVMQSSGGVLPVSDAVNLAAGAVLSGPAGGVAAARYVAELIGAPDLITLDMGGTSTDLSRIVEGRSHLVSDKEVGGIPVALPSLDIATLGAGGGSIAEAQPGGLLRVGPASAGADPGPACYGRGGTRPTVTDASVVLGYVAADNFLGGRMALDASAAATAIATLATKLGTSPEEAAYGIHQVVNTRIADGIRLISIRRGIDPRRFCLLSFGGAAGLHITDVAKRLGIGRIVAPREASVLSAWGMLASDLRYERVETHLAPLFALDPHSLRASYELLEADLRSRLSEVHDGPTDILYSAELRYGEQAYEAEIDVPLHDMDDAGLISAIAERFHSRHEQLYTYSLPGEQIVFVNARVSATGLLERLPAKVAKSRVRSPSTERAVYLGNWCDVGVVSWDELASGDRVTGPAIVESDSTTVLLRADDVAEVTELGWLDIAVQVSP